METKYSKEQFEGYTHRFIVQCQTEKSSHTLTIYSNSESNKDLEEFINEKKSKEVISFEITYKASKEKDEQTGKFLDDFFKEMDSEKVY